MAKPLHTPRVNNNDDTVQVIEINVAPGDRISRGDVLAEVETDKSISEVEAERDGYVLKILCAVDDQVAVGSVMMWIGDRPDEPVPETAVEEQPTAAGTAGGNGGSQPTAKARLLLREHGLSAAQVPASGERLSAADVQAYIDRQVPAPAAAAPTAPATERIPDVPGELLELSAEEHGMLTTVAWHRDRAAAAYLEIQYDPAVWEPVAADYAKQHGLMMSPLLPLMAYRLVRLAVENPRLNSTIIGQRRYQYTPVNLGFTVQAGTTLYLTVTQDAGNLDLDSFITALGQVQRHAMAHKLKPRESQGTTIAFSSMARWNVTRHQPILPPNCSLMVAHAATGEDGKATLGASYDHRVLSGFEVAKLLRELAKPPVLP